MNITLENLNFISLIWCGVAAVTFCSLLFIKAPYGRHIRSGWGREINNKLGWFLMEIISPIALSFFFWSGSLEKNTILIFIYSLWVMHYIYRSILFPMMTKTSDKKIPLSIALMAIFFNCINGFTNGSYLGNYAIHLDSSWIENLKFIIGLIVFFIGFYVHFTADKILINLRKENESGYYIPEGFFYKYISCPNYLGEMIQWIGFAILTWSPAGAVFALWTFANLFPRALSNHQWYKDRFSDYPSERKAVIPGII
jgi:3-oxo-5-alpha-steroid 4-dehydrogenase 1